MYRFKKVIAAESDDTRFEDGMSSIKDDFEYLMDTFDKMNRDGGKEKAIELMSQVHQMINEITYQAVTEVAE